MTEDAPEAPAAAPPSEAGPTPFHELLEIRPVNQDRGRGRMELAVQERHLRTLGIVHGGVPATLLDAAMGMAASSLRPAGHNVVTAQLNVNFIRPSRAGERLVATAEVIHSGRQTAVARGEVHTEERVLVASGTATFLYLPPLDRTGRDSSA